MTSRVSAMSNRKSTKQASISVTPPGLECLRPLTGLVVVQKIDVLEALAGVQEQNDFVIYSNKGEIVFWVQELTPTCGNTCVPALRPVRLNIFDVTLTTGILHMRRPLRCLCCFPGCLQIMEVYESSGDLLGTVEQTCRHCLKKFLVKDEEGEILFFIDGKCCICCQSTFQVLSRKRDNVVGTISKKLEGIPKDMFTDSDMVAISFPQDLDVRQKGVLLGALILIDYMYLEEIQPSCPWFCF